MGKAMEGTKRGGGGASECTHQGDAGIHTGLHSAISSPTSSAH